jgi:hypothetical protein
MLVLYHSSQFAISHRSYDFNLGSEILILVGDIRSRSWPNIGGTYGTYKLAPYISDILVWWSRIYSKEIVERRHGEPIKFLFLPKMGLLGSQAVNKKNCWLWILSNFLGKFFHVFMGKLLFFWNFFYNVGSALQRCLILK